MEAMDQEVIDITNVLKRNLVWDILPCEMASAHIPKNGLLTGTDDSDHLEHRWSHQRLNNLASIDPIVTTLSAIAGQVAGRAILETQGIEPSEELLEQYGSLCQVVVPGVLANLIEQGVLFVNDGTVLKLS